MSRRKLPTQADVARLAGVSVPVVSAVINGGSGTVKVGEESTARVIEAIKKLSYTPNPIARSLVRARSGIVAVFSFDPVFPSVRNDFFYPFLQGIEGEIEGSGHDLLLITADVPVAGRRSVYSGGHNRCGIADGAVILGTDPDRDELRQLIADGYPVVVVGRRDIPGVPIPHVAANYARATESLVIRACELGHRRFLYFGGREALEQQIDRRSGFAAGLTACGPGIEGQFAASGTDANEVLQMVSDAWAEGVTVIFAETAAIAEAVDRAATKLDIAVPSDLSICVLSNPSGPYAQMRNYTRFSIPRQEMGARAVRMLLERLDMPAQSENSVAVLECDIVQGTTLAVARIAQSR